MTNNQTKFGIISEKKSILEGEDRRMINYEWAYAAHEGNCAKI